jgi:hypothetical protein
VKRLLPLLCAALAAQAAAQNTNDPSYTGPKARPSAEWEEQERERLNPTEGDLKLPAWPKNEDLIEFAVINSATFRFFIDAASVSVGKDRVVRYTLIARSPSGVANVSYEGMRCDTGSYKIFAYGNDGRWSVRPTEWKDIEPKGNARWHFELRLNYFCQDRTGAIFTAKDGVEALRRGNSKIGVTGRLPP